MTGSVVITPGKIFKQGEIVTTAKLNELAAPTVLIENDSIDYRAIDPDIMAPQTDTISTSSASITWTLNANRIYHSLHLTLNHNVTSFTISNGSIGMFGHILIYNTSTYTLALPANTWKSGDATGPHTISPSTRSMLQFQTSTGGVLLVHYSSIV